MSFLKYRHYSFLTFTWLSGLAVSTVFIAACRLSLVAVHKFLLVPPLVAEHGLYSTHLIVGLRLRRVESSQTRDHARVPYIGRWILCYWTTRVKVFLKYSVPLWLIIGH